MILLSQFLKSSTFLPDIDIHDLALHQRNPATLCTNIIFYSAVRIGGFSPVMKYSVEVVLKSQITLKGKAQFVLKAERTL